MATLPADTKPDRIVTLDIIRGVAVMGILSVNIVAFAMIEAAYFNPRAYGGHQGADLIMWAANMVVIDGKMRTLFSILFGASMMLVIERAEAKGESAWAVHARRMVVLLGFGLIHFFFIWYGDILTLYAATGLVAFAFRRRSTEKLLAAGGAFLILHMLLMAGFLYSQVLAEAAASAPGASPQAIEEWTDGLGSFYPTAAKIAEDRAIFLGSYSGIVAHGLKDWWEIIPSTLIFIPNTLGLMLIGMAGVRSGYLTGGWDDRAYRRVAFAGILIGVLAGIGTVIYGLASQFNVIGMMAAFVVIDTPFITAMALGYAALIILLTRRPGWLAVRIAAAGRAAFSNYLGTSLVATFIFYGWGLGLYGSLSRAEAWLVAPLIWALMLLWSKPWLDRFNYGPLEWAWRSLARGELQPMRKRQRGAIAAAG